MDLNWVIWHFVNKCNFSCSFCYTRSHPKAYYGLPTGEILKIINNINQSTISVVSLIGGEPLMRKDIDLIIDSFSENIILKLDTNGSLIKSKWSNSLNKIKYFNVGVDGIPSSNEIERKNTLKVVDNIRFLQDKQKEVGITFLITKKNHLNFLENLKFILSLNTSEVQINLFGDVLEVEKNAENKLSKEEELTVLKQLKYLFDNDPSLFQKVKLSGWKNNYFFENFVSKDKVGSCGCGFYRASISTSGHLVPCPVLANYMEEFTDDESLLDRHNLQKYEISEIQKSELFSLYINREGELPQDCISCQFNKKCNHGCRSFNLLVENNFPGVSVKDCSIW